MQIGHIQASSILLFIETSIQEKLLLPIYTEIPISRIVTMISREQVERSVNFFGKATESKENCIRN